MKLKVFAIKAQGLDGGGMAIVAAMDREEAIKLASKIEDNTFYTGYENPDELEELPVEYDGEARVITHFETGG